MCMNIFEAIKTNNLELLKLMYSQDAAVFSCTDEKGLSPVITALYCGYQEIVDFIAFTHPKLNIYEASALGNLTRVRDILRKSPCFMDAYSSDGYTPLGMSCRFGRLRVAEFLVYTGAEVNKASANEMTVMPLHSASERGDPRVVKLLLSYGAWVNVKQRDGNSPLHITAKSGHTDIMRLLLDYDAKTHVLNNEGKTPVDLALENGHTESARLLLCSSGYGDYTPHFGKCK